MINKVNKNTEQAKIASKYISNTQNKDDLYRATSYMTSPINFSYSDLGSTGFARSNNVLKRKANSIGDAQNRAINTQNHALAMATKRLDRNEADYNAAHSAPFGGPLDMLTNNDMGSATTYGFLRDYLTREDSKNNNWQYVCWLS